MLEMINKSHVNVNMISILIYGHLLSHEDSNTLKIVIKN